MSTITNSQLIKDVLRAFIRVIGRRTSENYAIDTLGLIMKNLQQTYPFLQYVAVQKGMYSGEMDSIKIRQEIDTVDALSLGKSISETFDAVATLLGGSEEYDFEDAEYYFMNEVQDELGDNNLILLKNTGVNIDIKQQEFLDKMKEASRIKIRKMKVKDMFQHILQIIYHDLSKQLPADQVATEMRSAIEHLLRSYDLLKYCQVSAKKNKHDEYDITVNSGIDSVWEPKRGDALQKMIIEMGKITEITSRKNFVPHLKTKLDKTELSNIKKIGVSLEQIDTALQQQIHELLTQRTLEVLIELMGKKTSVGFAVTALDSIIKELQEKHEILRFIQIDKTKSDEGIKAFTIQPDINLVKSIMVGKALKDILKKTQDDLGNEATSFVQTFKQKMGYDYISEIEKIGVNLHILELREQLI